MRTYTFELDESYNVIIINAFLDGCKIRLMVDTGASNTVIDLTTLLVNDYEFSQRKGEVKVETAKGVANAYIFYNKIIRKFGNKEK